MTGMTGSDVYQVVGCIQPFKPYTGFCIWLLSPKNARPERRLLSLSLDSFLEVAAIDGLISRAGGAAMPAATRRRTFVLLSISV